MDGVMKVLARIEGWVERVIGGGAPRIDGCARTPARARAPPAMAPDARHMTPTGGRCV